MGKFKDFYLNENSSHDDLASKMHLNPIGKGVYKSKDGQKWKFDDKGMIQRVFDQDYQNKKDKEQKIRDKKAIKYALDKMYGSLIYKPEQFIQNNEELIKKGHTLYKKYEEELMKFDNHPGLFHSSEQYRKLYPEIDSLTKELKKSFKTGIIQKNSNGNFEILVNKKGHLLASGTGLFGGIAQFKTEMEAKEYANQKGYRIVK